MRMLKLSIALLFLRLVFMEIQLLRHSQYFPFEQSISHQAGFQFDCGFHCHSVSACSRELAMTGRVRSRNVVSMGIPSETPI